MPIPGFNEPFPSRDTIVKKSRKADDALLRYEEQSQKPRVDASPALVDDDQQDGQSASIPTTAIGGTQIAGSYEVSGYVQVVTPAGVASSFQVTLGWTYRGVPQSEVLTLENGNLTTTRQGFTQAIRIDGGSIVTYAIAYTSNPASAMVYDAYVALTLKAALS